MTMPEELPHRVSQIRHDLDDLYELMSQVEQGQTRIEGVLRGHHKRFEELQQTLTLHDGRLGRIEDNQHQTDNRLGQIQNNQQQTDSRLGRIEDNQQQTDSRLGRIENNQRRQFEQLSAQLAEILSALRGPAAADPAPESER
ncbi:MAG: hypothetical protein ACRDTG_24670 [Pseudonocardiaceae bacterium]